MNLQIEHNFKYHPPVGGAAERHAAVRAAAKALALLIDESLPVAAAREKATAITKVEEAMMWACAGIARRGDQLPAAAMETTPVIVNGTRHEIDLPGAASLLELKATTLAVANEMARQPEDWDLRDAHGRLVDLNQSIAALKDRCRALKTVLHLTLKPGVGG